PAAALRACVNATRTPPAVSPGRLTTSAAEHITAGANLLLLRSAAQSCRGCDLYRGATQAVSAEGPETARAVVVGEQPGDQEDRQGRPFVGPAGRVLDRGLVEAGIDRGTVYVTNSTKHFKFTQQRGKRRLHQKPTRGE